MKNRIFKREVSYRCNLETMPLIKLVTWQENYELINTEIILWKQLNDRRFMLYRANQTATLAAKIEVTYLPTKCLLTIKTSLRTTPYPYYLFMSLLVIIPLIKGISISLTLFYVPLGLSFLHAAILASSVYEDFKNVTFAITEKLKKEGIVYEEAEEPTAPQ